MNNEAMQVVIGEPPKEEVIALLDKLLAKAKLGLLTSVAGRFSGPGTKGHFIAGEYSELPLPCGHGTQE